MEWACKWQLRFNADKCESMRITHTRDKSTSQYMLDKVKDAKNFKDLGVTISKDFSWANHISITVNKANNLLDLSKRSVDIFNVNVISTLYLSLVGPILEYAVPVWCPYLLKDIRALESIQRRTSRLALNQRKGEMPHLYSCKLLNWPSLSDRRVYVSLFECCKFVFGYCHFNFYDFLEFSKFASTRANHPFKLYIKSARLNCYKYSFVIRIVPIWNDLPETVQAETLHHFKNKFYHYLLKFSTRTVCQLTPV